MEPLCLNFSASAHLTHVTSYRLNPFVQLIESHVFPQEIQYGLASMLTGEVITPLISVRPLLFALRAGGTFTIDPENLENMGDEGRQLTDLIQKEFLITDEQDPLPPFLDRYVVHPRQNPAVTYRSESGETVLVRTSMAERILSAAPGEWPKVVEEQLSPLPAALLKAADGSRTLAAVLGDLFPEGKTGSVTDDAREVIEFLTLPQRQLIKFTRDPDDLADLENPYRPCNLVPRNMFLSRQTSTGHADVIEFHQTGIADASWEFDVIEPTINHALRFPNEALAGLDYGGRFCEQALRTEVLPRLEKLNRVRVLEVGGGTGSFARSFLLHARQKRIEIEYQIVDLSSELMQSQQQYLASIDADVKHWQQDATKLELFGQQFDLIVSNEVIADFPVTFVNRVEKEGATEWQGPGAVWLEKYGLQTETAPASFLLNSGAMEFLERAWTHLSPGGCVILTEYGGESIFPAQAHHLNHEEFSIHFGHLRKCAERIGFDCRLVSLKDFLQINDEVRMLDGQEEQIMCLNHVLAAHGAALPFALISEREFYERYSALLERLELSGVTFSPLSNGFHVGPNLSQFMVLVMTKPS